MVWKAALAVSIWGLTASTAGAAPVLWRTLELGDDPVTVQTKLAAMPEIAKVKNVEKRKAFSRQDINMKNGGVPIFETKFAVATTYKDGKLSGVSLSGDPVCTRDGHALASKLADELSKKYPEAQVPLVSETEYASMSLATTTGRPQSTASVHIGQDTAAILRLSMAVEEPPVFSGGGAFVRALYDITRSAYNSQAEACGGGYLRTTTMQIAYMTKEDFAEFMKGIEEKNAAASKQASGNL